MSPFKDEALPATALFVSVLEHRYEVARRGAHVEAGGLASRVREAVEDGSRYRRRRRQRHARCIWNGGELKVSFTNPFVATRTAWRCALLALLRARAAMNAPSGIADAVMNGGTRVGTVIATKSGRVVNEAELPSQRHRIAVSVFWHGFGQVVTRRRPAHGENDSSGLRGVTDRARKRPARQVTDAMECRLRQRRRRRECYDRGQKGRKHHEPNRFQRNDAGTGATTSRIAHRPPWRPPCGGIGELTIRFSLPGFEYFRESSGNIDFGGRARGF